MTAIEEAREALAKWDGSSFPDVGYAYLAKSLRALIAEVERLSAPPSDDEREALTKVLLGVHPDTVLHDWGPRVIDARQNAERVIDAGFRRQGPITKSAALKGYYTIPERQRKRLTFESWLAALEATERVRSTVPSTTEQEQEQ